MIWLPVIRVTPNVYAIPPMKHNLLICAKLPKFDAEILRPCAGVAVKVPSRVACSFFYFPSAHSFALSFLFPIRWLFYFSILMFPIPVPISFRRVQFLWGGSSEVHPVRCVSFWYVLAPPFLFVAYLLDLVAESVSVSSKFLTICLICWLGLLWHSFMNSF